MFAWICNTKQYKMQYMLNTNAIQGNTLLLVIIFNAIQCNTFCNTKSIQCIAHSKVFIYVLEIDNMKTKAITFRLQEDVIKQIEEIASKKNISKTEVIRLAVSKLVDEEKSNTNAIQVIQEQNKQLQIALSTLNKITEEKERLIEEKEKRIQDLQKTIDVLQMQYRERNKTWWKFWKK